jgi:hypothetical protein
MQIFCKRMQVQAPLNTCALLLIEFVGLNGRQAFSFLREGERREATERQI